MKIPSKFDLRFQIYHNLSVVQNNKIQRKLNAIIHCILKSILASSDSFCLITSHLEKTATNSNKIYDFWIIALIYDQIDIWTFHSCFSGWTMVIINIYLWFCNDSNTNSKQITLLHYVSWHPIFKIIFVKGILWDRRWSPPSIKIFSHTCWFVYRSAFLIMNL